MSSHGSQTMAEPRNTANNHEKAVAMSVGNTDADRKGTALSFGMYRRRVVEQIMGRRNFPPAAKIEAYNIGEVSNRGTWSTLASSRTTGRRANLKPDEAAKSRRELLKAGHLRIKKRENGTTEISLVLRKDIETPEVPVYVDGAFYKTAAYRQFLAERTAFLDWVIAAKDLSHTDKVIAFGAGRLIDPNTWTINASYRAIGEAVGYSMETAKLSIGRLVARGYFKKRNIDGGALVLIPTISLRAADPGKGPGKDPGKDAGKANRRSVDGAAVSSANLGDLGYIGDFPSMRRPRSRAAPCDDSLLACSELGADTLITSATHTASAASTLMAVAEQQPSLSASTISSAPQAPMGRGTAAASDAPGTPQELPGNFVFDRGWPRSLGVDEARIDWEIDKFRDWALANGGLSASWRIMWQLVAIAIPRHRNRRSAAGA
jgi:hypothetical protein